MSENVSAPLISRKQETFISGLLSLPTMGAAARAAGVTEKTANRWMKEPAFQEAYQLARKTTFDQALQTLMRHTEDAICTLREVMRDAEAPHSARVRAAQAILDKAIEVYKTEELEQRIQDLEAAIRDRH